MVCNLLLISYSLPILNGAPQKCTIKGTLDDWQVFAVIRMISVERKAWGGYLCDDKSLGKVSDSPIPPFRLSQVTRTYTDLRHPYNTHCISRQGKLL